MRKTCLLMLAAASLFLAACVDDLTPDPMSGSGENIIVFSVTEGMPATRALSASDSAAVDGPVRSAIDFGMAENGRPLRFEKTVTRLNALPSAPFTKGAPATSDNAGTLYGSFTAIAYDGTSQVSIDGSSSFVFSYSAASRRWSHEFRTDPWANHSSLFFFMYMPELPSGATFDPTARTISFSYTVGDASAQNDLLFGGRAVTKAGYDPSTGYPVLFHHALSGVKFAIGNDSNGTVIKQVTLKHIAKNGSAVVNVGDSPSVSWSVPGSPSYEDYTLTVPVGTFAAGDDLNTEDLSLTFWLIPQSLSNDAELEVTYAIDGGAERTVSAKINEALGGTLALAAGELHTFTLNPDEVNVSITDRIAEGTKQNVVITNTGNVAAHLRAVIVANWQDEAGNIVAAWDFVPEEFVGLPGDDWTLGADGYYYTDVTVEPGENAPALFTSYTPPSTPPVAGAHLVMDVAVQAVKTKPGSWVQ